MLSQCRFHFPKFDSIAMDFYLGIHSPQDLQTTIFCESAQIACEEDSFVSVVRARTEFLLCCDRISPIAREQKTAPDRNLADFVNSNLVP